MYICTILHNFSSQRAAMVYNLVKAAWSPVVRSKQTGVLSHLVCVCEAKGMRHSTTPTPSLAIMHAYLISAVCSLIRWTCCMFEESLECANELGWPPPLMWLASDMNLVMWGGLCGGGLSPPPCHPLCHSLCHPLWNPLCHSLCHPCVTPCVTPCVNPCVTPCAACLISTCVVRPSVGSCGTMDCTSWSALFLPGTPCRNCELRAHVVPPVTDGAKLLRCCTYLHTYIHTKMSYM